MPEITRKNHFVPQFYLRYWSNDANKIWSYRLLVEHERVPEWNQVSIRSLAFRENLYTEVVDGGDSDRFEKWIKADFEDPAVPVFEKVASESPLTKEDFHHLARFFAAQDVRTPPALLDSLKRWEETIPDLLQNALEESVRELEQVRQAQPLDKEEPPSPGQEALRRTFRVVVDEEAEGPEGMAQIRAEITPGRSMWIGSIEHVLGGVAARLTEHSWAIVEPSSGYEWPTSDHPAMRLNYHSSEKYDFGGGWGSTGTDLLMPLTPRHLLYAQIGHDHGPRLKFPPEKTAEIQRLLCHRAHREIFATQRSKRLSWFRPRIVDPVMFKEEAEEWSRWHNQQSSVESPEEPGPQ